MLSAMQPNHEITQPPRSRRPDSSRHPLSRPHGQFCGMAKQSRQVVERVDPVQFALSKAYAGAVPVCPFWVTVTRKLRASSPFMHFIMRRRIVSGVS